MWTEAQVSGAARQNFLTRFLNERKNTESLCFPLSDEDCMLSSTDETSPPKWHLAHTNWFFENFILKRYISNFRVFDESFDYLFNSYYRTVGKFLPKSERNLISRPSVDQIIQYRAKVNSQIAELLETSPEKIRKEIELLLELGINHEQQHQELLLMDIKQNFFLHPQRPAYSPESGRAPAYPKKGPPTFYSFTGGLTEIGNNSNSFHYDNEGGRHRVWVEPFQLARAPVTNEEYLEFIKVGGYQNSRYWLSDGWDWIQKNKIELPLYWIQEDTGYQVMTLGGMKPLALSEPVSHVSYYEAQAYAHFKNARLPTEFEWEHAASRENLDIGLWQWTQSAYLPYPGYQALDQGLFEYNSKFMCNQFVLRGGCFATPRGHYRLTYRNFYYPHMRWQFCGFRLATDSQPFNKGQIDDDSRK